MKATHWHNFIGSTLSLLSGIASAQTCDWTPIGTGTGYATDCVTTASGDLIVGTRIDYAGNQPVGFLARWDGSSWSSVGGGVNDLIRVVELDANGDVLIGGWFTETASGLLTNGIARWDGSSWHAFGNPPGVRFGYVEAILPLPEGQFVAAGGFLQAGGMAAGRIARWDGSAWQLMGALYTINRDSTVYALAQLEDGSIVAAGNFLHADAGTVVNRIARWDGAAWQPMAGGMPGGGTWGVYSLLLLPNGNLLAGGGFTQAGGVPANSIARWDGAAWHPLGLGTSGGVDALALTPDGNVLVGGTFDSAGGVTARRIALWNPQTEEWSAIGGGIPLLSAVTTVLGVAATPNAYFVAGQFQDPNESPLNPRNVAQFRLDSTPPEVNPQPAPAITACLGGTITLTTGGAGPAPFTYQWQRLAAPGLWADLEDRVIPVWGTFVGARSETLTISNVAAGVPRTLRVVVSNTCDATPGDSVLITIAQNCNGDVNGDGHVDLADLALLLSTFGLCTGEAGFVPAADFDQNGCVELADLALQLANFGS